MLTDGVPVVAPSEDGLAAPPILIVHDIRDSLGPPLLFRCFPHLLADGVDDTTPSHGCPLTPLWNNMSPRSLSELCLCTGICAKQATRCWRVHGANPFVECSNGPTKYSVVIFKWSIIAKRYCQSHGDGMLVRRADLLRRLARSRTTPNEEQRRLGGTLLEAHDTS